MTDREKLIAMLDAGSCIIWECKGGKLVMSKQSEYLIDHLIANGVVVREKGEWKNIGGDEWCCTVCGYVASTEGRWEPMMDDFCRGCGSDMRKGDKNDV